MEKRSPTSELPRSGLVQRQLCSRSDSIAAVAGAIALTVIRPVMAPARPGANTFRRRQWWRNGRALQPLAKALHVSDVSEADYLIADADDAVREGAASYLGMASAVAYTQ